MICEFYQFNEISQQRWVEIKDVMNMLSKKISNDQELIQSDPTPRPQNQKGNNQTHKPTAAHDHSVLTICTQTGTCDTRSGDLVFFSAAFDGFSVFTKT